MKKLVLLLTVMFAMQAAIMAQDLTTGNITFNAHLAQTFNLIIVDGNVQEIYFNTAADYNDGVTESAVDLVGIYPGTTLINIEATEDWDLTILCPNFIGGSGGPIPIDNLGYSIVQSGAHGLSTGEVDYVDPGPVALTTAIAPLISKGDNSNAGDITDNAFTLHWQMGTMAGGGMHSTSMFDQMANGDFTTGEYQAIAVLTLNPALP